jgi:hypothetical protein
VRRRHLLASVLALAGLVACAPPAAALSGGFNGGNFDCVPGPPRLVVEFTDPRRITGTGDLACPTPGARAPSQFGPSDTRASTPVRRVPGQPCHFDFETPVQFRADGGTPQYMTLTPATSPGSYPKDPEAFTWHSDGWRNMADMPDLNAINATGPGNVYEQAGSMDFFYRWIFDGTWTAAGGQVKCVGQGPLNGWNTTCTFESDLATACFDPFLPPVPATSGGIGVGALGVDLNAFLRGQFFGGRITSRPARPHPGLTNIPTCFYVSGTTVNGQPADPQEDVLWERIVEGPQVEPEGRHVYFVFVVHVTYHGTVWSFGDGTAVTIPNGGSSPEAPPAACGNVPGQQFLVAHTYRRYSLGDGFHVTATHQYGVDVSELWRDSDPNPHRLDFFDVVPPVDVPALPLPAYVMPVVQEEGVPIG